MARLYANENFPLPVVEVFRNLGHDVLTTQDIGKAGKSISDPEVLAFAISENRAILTFNRKDFIHLHEAQPQHTGIIVSTLDLDFVGLAQRIHLAIESNPPLADRLLRINRPQIS